MKRFSDLPPDMRVDAVRPYYDILAKKRFSLIVKRGFDIAASAVLLILFSPAMLVIAVMIRRESAGPVFFRQARVTRYGRIFSIFKFRTMTPGVGGAQVTTANDARITKVGKTLRARRLDELPQLINILLGDMSFVGTRPEVPKYVDAYTGEMRATLLLSAGLTSRASIIYKDEDRLLFAAADPEEAYRTEVLPAKMAINLKSIKEFSLASDMKTLFETFFGTLLGG